MRRRTTSSRPAVIAISIGDPNGIGPEISLKAAATLLKSRRLPASTRFLLIGSEDILRRECSKVGLGLPPAWQANAPLPSARLLRLHGVPVLPRTPRYGTVTAEAGKASYDWVRTGIGLCMNGDTDALVTAPICKESWHKAGIDYPGHTELLAEATGTSNFAMLLMGGGLRVLTVTRHIPIREVARKLSGKEILHDLILLNQALRWMGVASRRIGVCGLNPHAGENGEIGDEEIRIIRPAVEKAIGLGIRAKGPLPADTLFFHALHQRYDAVLSMYHDQGLAPLKMLGFESGVNITLGLPMVRVSPDHGTAFDIAGKDRANPSSMVEALRQACFLAGRKNPWAHSPSPRRKGA